MNARSFSERVKWARANHQYGPLSQMQLAEMMNMSQSFIAKIELDAVIMPRVENLEKLSKALNVSIDWLKGKEDIPSKTS